MTRDPVPFYRARLLALGADEATLAAIDDDARRKVDEATEMAKASPPSSVDVIEADVWADGSSSWRN